MKKLRILMLLAAIGVAASLGTLFYLGYSARELPAEITTPEASSENSLNNVSLVQREAGKLKWVLNSDRADVFDGESYLNLEKVDLLIVTQDRDDIRITGDSGNYTKEKEDFWVRGNVKVVSGKGYVFYADAVRWDIDRQIIETDGMARAVGPNGLITGKEMTIDVQEQKVYIKNEVNAQLN